MAKGYQVSKVVKEVGSGVNDARPKFLALLEDTSVTTIVVEHKDRASRFGVRYIDSLLRVQGRMVEVVNVSDNATEDLLADLTSIISSFCSRLYGQRRATRKTETIVKQLQAKDEEEMHLVEQHVIDKEDARYAVIDAAAFASKNLYNAANYLVRQSFIHHGVSLPYAEVYHQMKSQEAYRALPTKVSQQVMKTLDKNWKSYFAACKAYAEDPTKFLGHPKLPQYKDKQDGRNLLVYTSQAISRSGLKRGVIIPSGLALEVKTHQRTADCVRIVPRHGYYVVEVVYEQDVQHASLDTSLSAALDIGLNNLATLTSHKSGFIPRIVNGRPVKSIHQFYNKEREHIQKHLGTKQHTSHRMERLTQQEDTQDRPLLAHHLKTNCAVIGT